MLLTRERHALVTGGAGFIGSHLVGSLLRDGWRVTVVDNFDSFYSREDKEANLASYRGDRCLRVLEADLRHPGLLRRQLDGQFDVVVHLAAKAGVRGSIEHPVEYMDVNVAGTQHLLELCREWGIRQFVFASSSSVYGINTHVPWSEDDRLLLPISQYASSKISGELLGHVYATLYGMRFIALRFFTVYGPRQRPDLAIRKFAQAMMAGQPIQVYGDGQTRRDYTYIDDIISGVRAAIEYDRTMFEVINLGNHRTVSLAELVSALEEALGVVARIERMDAQLGDVPQTLADIRKARALLGYEPATALPVGLAALATWLDAHAAAGSAACPAARRSLVAPSVKPVAVRSNSS